MSWNLSTFFVKSTKKAWKRGISTEKLACYRKLEAFTGESISFVSRIRLVFYFSRGKINLVRTNSSMYKSITSLFNLHSTWSKLWYNILILWFFYHIKWDKMAYQKQIRVAYPQPQLWIPVNLSCVTSWKTRKTYSISKTDLNRFKCYYSLSMFFERKLKK